MKNSKIHIAPGPMRMRRRFCCRLVMVDWGMRDGGLGTRSVVQLKSRVRLSY